MSQVFLPRGATGIAATSATARAALATGTQSGYPDKSVNVMVYNEGPNVAFVSIGNSSVVATLPDAVGGGSIPVPPGYFGFTLARSPDLDTHVAAICRATQTAQVSFTVGNGT